MKVTVRYVPEALVFHQARRLPFWRWINRSFQSRWHLLYLLKTHRTDCATLGLAIYLLRSTIRTLLLRERSQFAQRVFRLVLE